MLLGLEIFAVITGLCFIVLLIRQNIWCWFFGILSSLSSIVLFYYTKLYSESILYFYYVFIGFYGIHTWRKIDRANEQVRSVGTIYHMIVVVTGVIFSFALGKYFSTATDAARPYADAVSTIFSFLASYMEAHKILSAWILWIMINGFSIWLYADRGLEFYSGLMVIYFLLSIFGYFSWKKSMQ
ncbi:MAG: nicotinamide riboside transporter PnuC [Bacteroidia bacterium]|nr:nicotinamide riboside transporter PnuC [Bacteroidia bacterium]